VNLISNEREQDPTFERFLSHTFLLMKQCDFW